MVRVCVRSCIVPFMATNTKATAKRSRNTSSTTAKSAGVRSRTTKAKAPTKATVKARYAEAIATAKARGVKPPYEPTGAFLTAILRSFAIASLSESGLSTSKGQAEARRAFVRKVRAGSVTVDMVVHSNHLTATDGVGVFTDRPENTVRERLAGFVKVMGLPTGTLYAVRGDKWESGEAGSPVYIVRK